MAAKVADRESDEAVFLIQQLGGTGIVSDSCGDETHSTTGLVGGGAFGELAGHEKEEGDIKTAEEGDQGNVDPEGAQEEDEGDDEPGGQKESDCVGELTGSVSVSGANTEARNDKAGVGHPETTVGSESSCAEGVTSGEFPHAGNELGEPTNKAGHADDGIRDGNATSLDIDQGEDKGGAREREETERARVANDPQLRGGVVNIGVVRKSGSMGAAFIANGARVLEGVLLGTVAHGSGGRSDKSKTGE